MKQHRKISDGRFPRCRYGRHASNVDGGYPVVWYLKQQDDQGDPWAACARCADVAAEYGAIVVGFDIHHEGPAILCEGCENHNIESAYGDPAAENEDS